MIASIVISILYVFFYGFTITIGRYAKAGIGEAPLVYKSVIVQAIGNLNCLLLIGMSTFLIFWNWKLLLILFLGSSLTGHLILVPLCEWILWIVFGRVIQKEFDEKE